MRSCDLHVHSTASDGTLTPTQIVHKAAELGMRYVSLTDHDSVSGIRAAIEAAPDGLTVIPGVEISVSLNGTEVHLLGYGLDEHSPGLDVCLEGNVRRRLDRADEMLRNLRSGGLKIDLEDVLKLSGPAPISRAHLAAAMVEKGLASRSEALGHFLHRDSPAFVGKSSVSIGDAIAVVRAAGGLPVLAHPASGKGVTELEPLVEMGLAGVEVYHPGHDEAAIEFLLAEAARLDLLVTGGSDCHGPGSTRGSRLGRQDVPESCARGLLERLGQGGSES